MKNLLGFGKVQHEFAGITYGDAYYEEQIARFTFRILEDYLRRQPTKADAELTTVEPAKVAIRVEGIKEVRSIEVVTYKGVTLGYMVTSVIGNEGRIQFFPEENN